MRREYYGLISRICVFGDFVLDKFELNSETEIVKYEENKPSFRAIDLLINVDHLVFSNGHSDVNDCYSKHSHKFNYPMIFVLLDSSVTYYLVDNTQDKIKFLGNSPVGPVSLLSLFKLFTKRTGLSDGDFSLKHIIDLSEYGTNTNCDMLVSDIYGDAYKEMGLPANLLASTFGKLQFSVSNQTTLATGNDVGETFHKTGTYLEQTGISEKSTKSVGSYLELKLGKESMNSNLNEDKHINKVRAEDFAKSLMFLLTINTTQIAYLHSQINDATSVIFVGSPFSSALLRKKVEEFVNYWSKGALSCYFCSNNSLNPLTCALC